MAGSLQSRIKTWIDGEDVVYSDLNAEFDNVLTAMQPLLMDDYSTDVTQMQVETDPGEVGTESKATTLAGELARIRFMLSEITGETHWYTTPGASIAGLSNAIGSGLTDNRLVSGRVLTTSDQPAFLVANGAAKTVKLDGLPTQFIYYVDGTEYSIATDVTLTGLTAAPSTNNTALVNDAVWAAQYWTKYMGEDGTEIPIDTAGSEITALIGKFAAFKIVHAATTEYIYAYVKSATALSKVRRGYFFDSTDAAIPRLPLTDNDVLTLMKLTWVFAKTDGTLTATYNPPIWSDDEPTSPSLGDYWFDYSANTWKVYGVGSYATASAVLVGMCIQDATNCVASRSFEFFKNYDTTNSVELLLESNTQVKSRFPGSQVSVWGAVVKNDYNVHTWDMTLDLESGVTEAASTYYYFYITETGDKIISNKKPHDRREDLQGHYHPSNSWRCVGRAFNNASSNLEQVESYYRQREALAIRSVLATDYLLKRDRANILSGASATTYLPPLASCRGEEYTFIHDGTSHTQLYTLDAFGSETIGSAAATTIVMHTKGQVTKLLAGDSIWIITSNYAQTDWVSCALTVSAGFGTTANMNTFSRRRGKDLELSGTFTVGTVAGSVASITIPYSYSLDTTNLTATTMNPLGRILRSNATSQTGGGGFDLLAFYDGSSATTLFVGEQYSSDTVIAKANGNGVWITAGEYVLLDNIRLPISGFLA